MTGTTRSQETVDCADRLDAQLSELIEAVWACERAARTEDRLDAVIALAASYRIGARR